MQKGANDQPKQQLLNEQIEELKRKLDLLSN